MSYLVKRIVIIDSWANNTTKMNKQTNFNNKKNLLNSITDGYEIYNSSVYSNESLCGVVYILRKENKP